jgi:hypothetical protein
MEDETREGFCVLAAREERAPLAKPTQPTPSTTPAQMRRQSPRRTHPAVLLSLVIDRFPSAGFFQDTFRRTN